jgi:hypothetical protein
MNTCSVITRDYEDFYAFIAAKKQSQFKAKRWMMDDLRWFFRIYIFFFPRTTHRINEKNRFFLRISGPICRRFFSFLCKYQVD